MWVEWRFTQQRTCLVAKGVFTLKPMQSTCPEATNEPLLDTETHETSLVCPRSSSCLPSLIVLRTTVDPRG